MTVMMRAGFIGVVLAAACCWGCGGSSWKAPPIDGEFLVAEPVAGEEQDTSSPFDEDEETPAVTPSAQPAPAPDAADPPSQPEATSSAAGAGR